MTTGTKLAELHPGFLHYPIVARADPTGARAVALCKTWGVGGYFEVYVIDMASLTWTPVGLFTQEHSPISGRSLALTPDGTTALVVGEHLHFVDLATLAVGTIGLPVWDGPVAVTRDGTTAVVGQPWPPALRAVDIATQTERGAALRSQRALALAPHPQSRQFAALEAVDDEDVALVDAGGGLTLLARAPTGPGMEGDGPTAVAVDPTGRIAVTANERSDNLTLLDLALGRATSWISVPDRPMEVRLVDGGRTAVIWHAEGDLSVVDLTSATVLTRLPTGARCEQNTPLPTRMAPFGDCGFLLYGLPNAAAVEVDGAATRLLATQGLGRTAHVEALQGAAAAHTSVPGPPTGSSSST